MWGNQSENANVASKHSVVSCKEIWLTFRAQHILLSKVYLREGKMITVKVYGKKEEDWVWRYSLWYSFAMIVC